MEDDEPVPKVRQMMNEAGYIDYIREQSATPAQEKSKLDNIENLFSSIQNLINRAEDVDEKNIESVIRKLVLLDMLEQQQEEEDTDKVNLLTLHAAKVWNSHMCTLWGLKKSCCRIRTRLLLKLLKKNAVLCTWELPVHVKA